MILGSLVELLFEMAVLLLDSLGWWFFEARPDAKARDENVRRRIREVEREKLPSRADDR
jgi:hypothetical protein